MHHPLSLAVQTLFLGVEQFISYQSGWKVAFLRAVITPKLRDFPESRMWAYEQSFAPAADALREAGYPVLPQISADNLDCVLFLPTRFAEENLFHFARAWRMLKQGGWMVVAQHNDFGAKRLLKALAQLNPHVESSSKHHCRVVAIQKQAEPESLLAQWEALGKETNIPATCFKTVPGIFSAGKIDAGSQFLIESLPKTLSGCGADIAAGLGYLTAQILSHCPSVASMTLFEAEKRALDRAERNLTAYRDVTYIWQDAAKPLQKQGFDWAVMNPPAHDMQQHAPESTDAMFEQAAKSLKPQGALWIVANRHLPYERSLQTHFTSVVVTHENRQYKVIQAIL